MGHTNSANISEILNWDSDFFGFKVGRIVINDIRSEVIINDITYLKEKGCALIYLISPEPLDIRYSGAQDINLVDIKRSYILEKPKIIPVRNIVRAYTGNSEVLYNLAFQAGEHSRFKVDKNITDNDFKRLYRLWIDNSLSKDFADYTLVINSKDNPMGFITAKIKNHELSIGLFATNAEYRGRGIGTSLIQSIINEGALKELAIEVTTQASNKTACKFYENKGFKLNSEEYIYHVWL